MKASKTIIVALFTAVLFLTYSNVIAQEEETKETPYWYVGSFKVPWAKVDSLQKLVKEYTIPVVAEAKKRVRSWITIYSFTTQAGSIT